MFTVVWQPSAIQELARIWNTAMDRNAVAQAADAIDAKLKRDPFSAGESRAFPELRYLVIRPLVVAFRISEADGLVTVFMVKPVQKKY